MSKNNTAMSNRKHPRRKLSPAKYLALKQYIYERDDCSCVFCGRTDLLTPAHIKRRSQGGHDAANNIVTACLYCHQAFDSYKITLPEHIVDMLAGEPGLGE